MSIFAKKSMGLTGKIAATLVFSFIFLFNIVLSSGSSSSTGTISVLGFEMNLFQAAQAEDGGGQNFKMSSGSGCPSGCIVLNGTNNWMSCHLPGSVCSLMSCYCFK